MSETTREPQYQRCLALRRQHGLTPLGLMSNQTWHDDPKRLVFTLSRYKFAAKMLSGRGRVLEVGCADAFGTRIVRQEVEELTAIDFDPVFVADVKQRMDSSQPFEVFEHDMLAGPVPGGPFDAAYSLDVLEHIAPGDEDRFMRHLVGSLSRHSMVVIGSPSLESQQYASEWSKAGHVNCKRGPQFKAMLEQYFHHVMVFSMNDEVIHTGFYPMAHYLMAVACEPIAAA